MASKRVRQLRKGAEPKIITKNRDIVISLREIAAGYVREADRSASLVLTNKDVDSLPEATAPAVEENTINE